MPPAIISPSVLASDFGQLTAECKRMLRGGAQWLHMGTWGGACTPVDDPLAEMPSLTKMSWMGESVWNVLHGWSDQLHSLDISSRI